MRIRPLLATLALIGISSMPAFASASQKSTAKAQQLPPIPIGPTRTVHTDFIVETNKLGQVTRATKVTRSDDSAFNAMTYGNALQTFIRKANGTAIAGVYKLSYDYSPQRKKVRRTVALVHAGGVNPNAMGAVNVEAAKLQAKQNTVNAASSEASALPNLHQMLRHHH